MWIEIEGEQFLNLDLVERVEMKQSHKVAVAWASSVPLCESPLLYAYMKAHRTDPEMFIQPMV